jgi:hypothetical protein
LRIFVELPQKANKKKLKNSSQNVVENSPEVTRKTPETKLNLESQLEIDNAVDFYSDESNNSCLKRIFSFFSRVLIFSRNKICGWSLVTFSKQFKH